MAREYSNISPELQLVGAINDSVTTFAVNGDPVVAADFTAVLDPSPDKANEEVVLVTDAVQDGSNWDLTVVRGYDGTTAKSHASGTKFLHAVGKEEFDLLRSIEDDYLSSGNIGGTVQAHSDRLGDIAALAAAAGNIMVGNATTWVAESGATARASLGLGEGNSPMFAGLTVATVADGATITVQSNQNDASHSASVPFGSFVVYSADGSGAGAGIRGGLRIYPISASGGGGDTVITASDGSGEIEVARFASTKAVTLPGTLVVFGASVTVAGKVVGSTTNGYLDLFGDAEATNGVRILDTGAVRIGAGGTSGARLEVWSGGTTPSSQHVLTHDTYASTRFVGTGYKLGASNPVKGWFGLEAGAVVGNGLGEFQWWVDGTNDSNEVATADKRMALSATALTLTCNLLANSDGTRTIGADATRFANAYLDAINVGTEASFFGVAAAGQAAAMTVANTGDWLTSNDSQRAGIVDNIRTRIAELQTAQQNLGFIAAA